MDLSCSIGYRGAKNGSNDRELLHLPNRKEEVDVEQRKSKEQNHEVLFWAKLSLDRRGKHKEMPNQ
jgi:hypothetical protein